MEIEFALEFDREHDEQNRVFLYQLRDGTREAVLFDSDMDHDGSAFRLQDVMVVDVCLPQNVEYELAVTDSAGDGFSRQGEILVFQNGQLLGSNEGNFGSMFSLVIPALSEPTSPPVTSPPTAVPITPTLSPTASPVQNTIEQTEAPVAVLMGRTQAPTMMSNLVDTARPTHLQTLPPKKPTRAPRPIKMMKKKTLGSMSKLGSSISHSSSMSMKLKSKTAKSGMNKSKKKTSKSMKKSSSSKQNRVPKSMKSKGTRGPKGPRSYLSHGDIFGP